MRREPKLLLQKSLDSLILTVDRFNGSNERGRITEVLILLDHSFEMLLKAAILHRGGEIREPDARQTLGFDQCVRRSLSDGKIRFLSEEEALALQAINGLRDAAQHHLIDVSEEQLYLHTQSGITLFQDILSNVFAQELATRLPRRVAPVSTAAPSDLATLFEREANEIKKLLAPGTRKRLEAYARLRPLAILDATVKGEKLQPGFRELQTQGKELARGKGWQQVFPGAASMEFTMTDAKHTFNLRFTKKQGVPITVVPEGTLGASVVGMKRVNELDFYNLGRDSLAKHVGLTGPKATAVIRYLNLQQEPDCSMEIVIDKSRFRRYSQRAIERIRETLAETPIEEIWRNRGPKILKATADPHAGSEHGRTGRTA